MSEFCNVRKKPYASGVSRGKISVFAPWVKALFPEKSERVEDSVTSMCLKGTARPPAAGGGLRGQARRQARRPGPIRNRADVV